MVEINRMASQILQELDRLEEIYIPTMTFNPSDQTSLLFHYYKCLHFDESNTAEQRSAEQFPTPTRAELIERYKSSVNRLMLLAHEAEYSVPVLLVETSNGMNMTEEQLTFRNRMERLFHTLGRATTVLIQLCMEREYHQINSRPFQRIRESQPFRQYVLNLYSPIAEDDWLVNGCWRDLRNDREKYSLMENIIVSQLIKEEVVHDNERIYWPKKIPIRIENTSGATIHYVNSRYLEWDSDIPDLKTFVINFWPFGGVHNFISTFHGVRDSVLEDLKINASKTLLPVRKINRYSLSFRDGIYDILNHRFVSYISLYNEGGERTRGYERCHTIGGFSFNYIDENIAPYCNFQSAEEIIDYSWEHNLPIIYVLKVQGFEKDNDLLWTLGLLGRCLYHVGHDKWELCLSLVGVAQSGKSSIITFFEKLYGDENIGILENIGETIFGMEGLMNKLLIIATELTLANNMDKTKLLRMLSGETISVARKFKKPTNIRWRTPLMVAGNENFIATETQGQFSRRIAKIAFRIKPNTQQHDSSIVDRLKQGLDISETLVLLNLCYKRILELSEGSNFVSIWDIVPPRLYNEHQNLMLELNPLLKFLHQDVNIRVGPSNNTDISCPEKELRRRFLNYIQVNNLPKVQWDSSLFEMVFTEMKISRRTFTNSERQQVGIVMLIGVQIAMKSWTNH